MDDRASQITLYLRVSYEARKIKYYYRSDRTENRECLCGTVEWDTCAKRKYESSVSPWTWRRDNSAGGVCSRLLQTGKSNRITDQNNGRGRAYAPYITMYII